MKTEFNNKSQQSFDIHSFGNNYFGQLGLNNTTKKFVPTKVNLNFKLKQIACGSDHTTIISEYGDLYTYGNDWNGQLGLGNSGRGAQRISPTKVNLMFKVKSVVCGDSHTFITSEDGELYTCGRNFSGQLGLGSGDKRIRKLLTKVENLKFKVKQVVCGFGHTVIISEDDDLYVCGGNYSGQLALGDIGRGTERYVFTKVENLNFKVKSVSCGGYHTVIISEDGDLYTCGNNKFGQLGLGDSGDETYRFVPTQVKNLKFKVKSVACGEYHTVIISEDEDLYTYGLNKFGQLGLDDGIDRYIPTKVDLKFKVKSVGCGNGHTVIISEDEDLYTCGNNDDGQLGFCGDGIERFAKVEMKFKVKVVACGNNHNIIGV